MRPLEKRAARKVLFLLAVFFAFLVVARLGYGANDVLDLLRCMISTRAQQLRDRVVRDEHAVVGPALNLLDLQGELNTHLAEERLGCTDLTLMMRLCHDD